MEMKNYEDFNKFQITLPLDNLLSISESIYQQGNIFISKYTSYRPLATTKQ